MKSKSYHIYLFSCTLPNKLIQFPRIVDTINGCCQTIILKYRQNYIPICAVCCSNLHFDRSYELSLRSCYSSYSTTRRNRNRLAISVTNILIASLQRDRRRVWNLLQGGSLHRERAILKLYKQESGHTNGRVTAQTARAACSFIWKRLAVFTVAIIGAIEAPTRPEEGPRPAIQIKFVEGYGLDTAALVVIRISRYCFFDLLMKRIDIYLHFKTHSLVK